MILFESREIKAFSNELVMGLLLTILGVIILLNKPVFLSILPIITGMWVIIRSIMKYYGKYFCINKNENLRQRIGLFLK